MSLILLSDPLTSIAGTVGETSYQNSRYGIQRKSKPPPTNRKNPSQQLQQSYFSQLAFLWSSLTSEQKGAWALGTISFPSTNKVGETITLTGVALFQELNLNLLSANLSPITVPPSSTVTPDFALTAADISEGGDFLTWTGTGATPSRTTTTILYASRPFSTGQTPSKNTDMLRIFTHNYTGSSSISTTFTNYSDILNVQALASEVVWFGIRNVDNTSGISSIFQKLPATWS